MRSSFPRSSTLKTTRALGAALALVLAGCATVPPRGPGEAAAWLGGSPTVVVRADATQVKAFQQVTRDHKELRAVGERTRVVWMGFTVDGLDLEAAAQTASLVLEGDFPRGAASWMLDWNSAWKKAGPQGPWTSAALDLSVGLPEEGVVTVHRRAPVPATNPSVLRDLDPALVNGSALWLSFWDPGEALFGAPGAKLLPVSRLDVVLQMVGDALEGPVVLHFVDDRSARAASVLLRLMAPQIRGRFGQELTWTVEGNRLVGTTLRWTQDELRALTESLVTKEIP